MKKLKVILLLILVIFLSACSFDKKAIDSSEFKEIMRDNSYYVVNSKDQFSEYDYILNSYIAIDSQQNYQIEFYELEDEENAIAFYDYNKDIFEGYKISTSIYTDVSFSNNSKYTLTTDDSYRVLSRVDNTVIYISVDKKYKDEVKSILKELGY